ncbi:MAG: hypothetical protein A2X25_01010 [Chloroflexi bacterium GWB2_49_20]|nr:MAG: hypothetical protein A2X25_01010 [Chloroflexi bacterium GWB2_49_20]OGN78703.1 MAG: hypothetical protein A2X26_07870 [Chloroflexi bacterium GWC2_49_37]HBG73834.1 hypothetical protein [Anaerolineae bacterium]HCM97627.1 hypothetical protein [Anaerolineae bacterium]
MLKTSRSLLIYFIIILAGIAALTFVSPQEKSLGPNVRIVYLHGAWVLTAEVAFLAAALVGSAALVTRRAGLHTWSQALGRTGTLFWVTYLPLSLWAMQSNWNGLFLAEPRFRLALIFAITAVLLQVGLWLFNLPWLTSVANIIFIVVLRVVFASASNIMHPPPSPIFNSGNYTIITFFIALNLLAWGAAYLVTRLWLALATSKKYIS